MAPVLRPRAGRGHNGGSAAQSRKTAHVRSIAKGWPKDALGVRTRGLIKGKMACYRRATTQTLLHCPKFLNWIATHDREQKNAKPKKATPIGAKTKVTQKKDGKTKDAETKDAEDGNCQFGARCPACCFKHLAAEFWNPGSTTAALNRTVRNLDGAVFHTRFGAPWTRDMGQMECPAEFMTHILQLLEDSARPDEGAWLAQIDAMFFINVYSLDTCPDCQLITRRNNPPEGYLSVPLDEEAPDSLDQALYRYFNESGGLEAHCPQCSGTRQHARINKIDAGPQVLNIQLNRFWNKWDEKSGKTILGKWRHPVRYPQTLNLKAYQPDMVASADANGNANLDSNGDEIMVKNLPLRYRLQAVTRHFGANIGGGHYMARVRSQNRVEGHAVSYLTDDNATPVEGPIDDLLDTPKSGRIDGGQPYILTYVLM